MKESIVSSGVMRVMEITPWGHETGALVTVSGFVAPGFEGVRTVFQQNFEVHREVGASVCAYLNGELVVDLWGGVAHPSTGQAWEADSMINTFSVTKGIVALAILQLEDQGKIDLDAPVSSYWPEFGQAGKARITFRQILNHRSGVVAIESPLSLEDCIAWRGVDEAIERQEPLWEPGTDQGYHGVSWGFLVRCIVQRATGNNIGDLVNAIAKELQADAYLGVPDDKLPLCATLVYRTPGQAAGNLLKRMTEGGLNGRFFRNVLLRPRGDAARAFSNPAALGARGFGNYNRDDVRQAVLPWTNVHASARGVARMYAPLAADGEAFGVRVVSPEAAAIPRTVQSWTEFDRVMRKPLGFAQGFIKELEGMFSPSPGFMGHPGTGGCLGFADPDTGLSFGYVMNRMRSHVRSPTAIALSQSVYAAMNAL